MPFDERIDLLTMLEITVPPKTILVKRIRALEVVVSDERITASYRDVTYSIELQTLPHPPWNVIGAQTSRVQTKNVNLIVSYGFDSENSAVEIQIRAECPRKVRRGKEISVVVWVTPKRGEFGVIATSAE
jgi:hypothetical protein